MLRLKSPGHERFFQSPMLEATFGGGEANVAVGLARLGLNAAFVSAIPENPIGNACVAELRKHSVDTSLIVRQGNRLGVYFLEAGANQRPSVVVYDRSYSAISEAMVGDIDWNTVFDGATWFHITGITPAISLSASELALEAVKTAREKGVTFIRYDLEGPPDEPGVLEEVDVTIEEENTGIPVVGVSDSDPNVRGVKVPLPDGLGEVFVLGRYSIYRTDLQFKKIYDNQYNEKLGDLGGTNVIAGFRFKFSM